MIDLICTTLINNKSRDHIYIDYTRITESEADQIVEAFKLNSTIKDLYIEHCFDLSLDVIKKLIDILAVNNSIKCVSFKEIGLSDESVKHLVDILKNNTSVECLSISSDSITDVGAQHISDLLKHNTVFKELLKELTVYDCHDIGLEGTTYICDSVIKSSLTYLELCDCCLGPTQIRDLLSSKTLTYLDISDSDFGVYSDECVKAVIKGLLTNNTLTQLEMRNCNLTDEQLNLIADKRIII